MDAAQVEVRCGNQEVEMTDRQWKRSWRQEIRSLIPYQICLDRETLSCSIILFRVCCDVHHYSSLKQLCGSVLTQRIKER